MLLQVLITGFVLGIFSSLHCIGMCGPLAMAIPVHQRGAGQRFLAVALYQVGRISTYLLLGLLSGWAGRRLYLAGVQQWFSVIAGLLILVVVIYQYALKGRYRPKAIQLVYNKLQQFMIRMLHSNRGYRFFLLGMANGLLPCGMVYIALAGAVATGALSGSVVFMLGFGAGTLPAMMAAGYFSQIIRVSARNMLRRAVPYLVGVMAVLLILRGLNLGIPFISPAFAATPEASAVSCH